MCVKVREVGWGGCGTCMSLTGKTVAVKPAIRSKIFNVVTYTKRYFHVRSNKSAENHDLCRRFMFFLPKPGITTRRETREV